MVSAFDRLVSLQLTPKLVAETPDGVSSEVRFDTRKLRALRPRRRSTRGLGRDLVSGPMEVDLRRVRECEDRRDPGKSRCDRAPWVRSQGLASSVNTTSQARMTAVGQAGGPDALI